MGIPLVSVVIPTYNRAHLVNRAIATVLAQSYQDFEVVVVDDGSKDNTRDVVSQIEDKRIRLITHEINQGASAARNTGIMAAKGRYVAFHDSDDEWLANKLETQMRLFETLPPEVGVVYSDMCRISANKRLYFRSLHILPTDATAYEQALGPVPLRIGIQTTVIRRECFDKAGIFDRKLPALEDFELLLRMAKYYRFCHIPEALVNHYDTRVSVSHNMAGVAQAYRCILDSYYDDIAKHRKTLASYYANISLYSRLARDHKESIRYLSRAAGTWPITLEFALAAFFFLAGPAMYDRLGRLKHSVLAFAQSDR